MHSVHATGHHSRICIYALTPQGAVLGAHIARIMYADLCLPHSLAVRAGVPSHADHAGLDLFAALGILPTNAPACEPMLFTSLGKATAERFTQYAGHIFIAACGIVVRVIAPLLRSKEHDPAVVALDQHGSHVISLLSGHLGGANELAKQVASITGGQAVITTATDTEQLPSMDMLAVQNNLAIADIRAVRHVNAALLAGTPVILDDPLDMLGLAKHTAGQFIHAMPSGASPSANMHDQAPPKVSVTLHHRPAQHAAPNHLVLHPRCLHAGMGCRKGVSDEKLINHLLKTMLQHDLAPKALCAMTSVEAKRGEPGLHRAAERLCLPLYFFNANTLAAIDVPHPSTRVSQAVGTPSVAEASALASARRQGRSATLLIPKTAAGDITTAVAQEVP